MHIALFGLTGRTGRLVLPAASQAGHAITALVRGPSRVDAGNPALHLLSGSLTDLAAIAGALRGAQAVISVLGPSQNKPVYEISAATSLILSAMRSSGVRRLIVTSGAGVRDAQDAPGPFDRLMGALVKRVVAHVYEDMRRTVELVRHSDLDWTIVRVPMLVDGPRTGRLRTGYLGRGVGSRLSRLDLADFLVAQLADKAWICKAPVVSN